MPLRKMGLNLRPPALNLPGGRVDCRPGQALASHGLAGPAFRRNQAEEPHQLSRRVELSIGVENWLWRELGAAGDESRVTPEA